MSLFRGKKKEAPAVAVEQPKVYVEAEMGAPQVFLSGSAAAWTQSFQGDRVATKKSFERRSSDGDELLVRRTFERQMRACAARIKRKQISNFQLSI